MEVDGIEEYASSTHSDDALQPSTAMTNGALHYSDFLKKFMEQQTVATGSLNASANQTLQTQDYFEANTTTITATVENNQEMNSETQKSTGQKFHDEFVELIWKLYHLLYYSQDDYCAENPIQHRLLDLQTFAARRFNRIRQTIAMDVIIRNMYQFGKLATNIGTYIKVQIAAMSTVGYSAPDVPCDINELKTIRALSIALCTEKVTNLVTVIAQHGVFLKHNNLLLVYILVFCWFQGTCTTTQSTVSDKYHASSIVKALTYTPAALTPFDIYLRNNINKNIQKFKKPSEEELIDLLVTLSKTHTSQKSTFLLNDGMFVNWQYLERQNSQKIFQTKEFNLLQKKILLFLEIKNRELTQRKDVYCSIDT